MPMLYTRKLLVMLSMHCGCRPLQCCSVVWGMPWAWTLEWHESWDDVCGCQQALEVMAISAGDVSR